MKIVHHRRVLNMPPASADTNGLNQTNQQGGDSYLGGMNFDTNMVIILATLLCALILALGLNAIVRCMMRCSRGLIRERAVAGLVTTMGLEKQHLRRIPVAVYGGPGVNLPAMTTECPICLGEFLDGEKVRVLPGCNHGFHVGCIDKWLTSHSSCPNCRHSLLEQGGGSATEQVVEVAAAGGSEGSPENGRRGVIVGAS